jgi:hypothetical protein
MQQKYDESGLFIDERPRGNIKVLSPAASPHRKVAESLFVRLRLGEGEPSLPQNYSTATFLVVTLTPSTTLTR